MRFSRLLFFLLAAAALALLLALLDKSPNTGHDWLVYLFVTWISGAAVYGVWRATEQERLAAPTTAALLRLAVGVALMTLLPVFGYANSAGHQNGYFYLDAQKRDIQAWGVANSGRSLVAEAFSGQHAGDQYGGMLLLSSFIYRTVSLDLHRPFLILIVNAAAAACGVYFIGYATRRWLGAPLANKTAWIMALYPEAVLLSATHMREAYLIPLIGMSLFGLAHLQEKRRDGWIWLLAAGILLVGFSPLAMVATFGVLFSFWLFEPGQRKSWKPIVIFGSILLIGIVAVLLAWSNLPSLKGTVPWESFLFWIQKNITYQSYLSERASGIVQSLQRWVGPQWAWLVTLIYGIAQPVLPAVVGDPDAAGIMRFIGFFRAAGWYALAFFLVYGVALLWNARSEPRRVQLITLALLLWGWIGFTALIAGGDQWDNPRYRTFLLPWMALFVAWAWQWALAHRDRWLWRWLSVEAFFILSFTVWYLDRYYIKTIRLGIREMIFINLLAAMVIFGSGLIRRKKWGKR